MVEIILVYFTAIKIRRNVKLRQVAGWRHPPRIGDNSATERYKAQYRSGLTHLMKDTLLSELKTNKDTKDINVLCQND